MQTSRFLVALLVLLLGASALPAQEQSKYLTAFEILQWLERSTTTYTIRSGEDAGAELDNVFLTMIPQRGREIDMETVTFAEDGTATLDVVRLPEDAQSALVAGEKAFTKGRFADARVAYERGRDLAPDVYIFHSYIGDTYFREGDYETALVHYDSAIALNPRHYQAHFFRGSTLLRLGRHKESLASFVRALALNPRHEMTISILTSAAPRYGIIVRPSPLLHRGAAWRDKDGVQLAYDGETPWLAYAAAKALFLGEPEFRKQLVGSADTSFWSSGGDVQAYVALLTSYLTLREDDKIEQDPQLDRLASIVQDHHASELAVWEFGSRIKPTIMMTQPEDRIVSMETFIRAYIIVDNE